MVTCFSLLLLPFFPFKIDVILEYLVIADEVQVLGVMFGLCEKDHSVNDTFILYFVPDFVSSKNRGALTFFFNSMWTMAIHLVTIFRRGNLQICWEFRK